MNKGIIMEVKKSYAIALNDQGIMEKIAYKQNMEVGQKIFYFEDDIVKASTSKTRNYSRFYKSFGSIAALFLLVFTFFNTMRYEQAFAVVSLDINPSIQIEADSKQKIIKVEGVNDDGKKIDFNDVKGLELYDGIEKIKEKLVEKNYMDKNKEVLVGVAFVKSGDNSNYEETLKEAIRSTFNTEDITYIKADKKEVDEAKTEGISLGRYKAKESISVDEPTKESIGKAPVKEITALIKDKEDVIQWEAKDAKVNDVPVANEKPEVKNENPVIDGNANANANLNPEKDKPVSNVSSGNPNVNIGKDTDKEINKDNKAVNDSHDRPKNNDVLEVEPEAPAVKEPDKNQQQKPTDDKSINITPDNGAIKNNPTSGKIEEEPKTTTPIQQPVDPTKSVVTNTTKN